MKLIGLLHGLEYTLLKGDINENVINIVNDSRKVKEGSLFVCIEGLEQDGHKYITAAIQQGAKAVLVQKDIKVNADITVVYVKNTRIALAHMANIYYDYPTDDFDLIGITGTNGKTSTVFLIKYILEEYKKKTGIIGTIENRIGEEVLKTSRTTPESIDLQYLFSQMSKANVNAVIMEVSSHALDLHRVDECKFDIGVFTNLTLDHLDYHKTMESYRDAKLKLFKMCNTGVVNIDDEAGKYMLENGNCNEYITYGCENDSALINATDLDIKINGTTFNVGIDGGKYIFEIQTPGKFSVYNALAAICVCKKLGVPINIIQKSLKEKSRIKGRFETINSDEGYYAVVDYAHSPDGLENVLNTISEISEEKVITVFGCGGNRDKSKRPKMGKIAGERSDFVIITSDNPRKEEPLCIIEEIEKGIKETSCSYIKIEDREEAINKALSMAKKGDIVLIAGKGHENYQTIGETNIHFDDAEIILKYINKL